MIDHQRLQTYKEGLLIEQDIVDSTLGTISQNIVSLAMLLGTLTVAAVPALFTGYSIYALTAEVWGETMAQGAGWVFAIGLEAVGMVTSNVALKLYRAWREGQVILEEFLVTIALMIVYVVAVVLIIAFVENLPLTLQAVGIGSPFLAVVLYIARGLYLDHMSREIGRRMIENQQRDVEREQASEERQHRREMERLRIEQGHQRKLEQIRLEAERGRNLPETFRQEKEAPASLPGWLPVLPDNLKDFRQLIEAGDLILPPGLTGSDLQKYIPAVGTDRTGRNWLEAVNYRNGHGG